MANYIAINNQRRGPFPEEELLQNGMIPDSLVWCKGMDGWTRASDVPVKWLTGYSCPGCGLQRAFHELLHDNFSRALQVWQIA